MLYRERNCILRAEYQKELEKIIQEVGIENVVYLDESGFDARDNYRNMAWGAKGVKIIGEKQGKRVKRTSLLMAKRGKEWLSPMVFKGTCNTGFFIEWLEKMLLPELKEKERKQVIIMDNASIHRNKKVREIIESNGYILHYLSPYSPDYNPIENVFGTIKKILRYANTDLSLEDVLVGKC